MTHRILIGLVGLFATICVTLAQTDDALLIAARRALPQDISTNEIVRAVGTGLWSSNRTAVAIAIGRSKASVLFVFLRQSSGEYLAVDVGGIESQNFGHLGAAGRTAYERFETTRAVAPWMWICGSERDHVFSRSSG
jgi:hypothetical protein